MNKILLGAVLLWLISPIPTTASDPSPAQKLISTGSPTQTRILCTNNLQVEGLYRKALILSQKTNTLTQQLFEPGQSCESQQDLLRQNIKHQASLGECLAQLKGQILATSEG
jgi:hypothetical protein